MQVSLVNKTKSLLIVTLSGGTSLHLPPVRSLSQSTTWRSLETKKSRSFASMERLRS
jgi:hypothetical protein